jgi:hypothetical protein
MKQPKNVPAAASDPSPAGEPLQMFPPLNPEGVAAWIDARYGTGQESPILEPRRYRVAAAIRDAWWDVELAKVNLALAKEHNNPVPNSTREAALNIKAEEIHACRKLSVILEDLECADEKRLKLAGPAQAAADRLATLQQQAGELEHELEALQARDAREEFATLTNLEDEQRWLNEYLENGAWKLSPLDFKTAYFEKGLHEMVENGRYHGEVTKDGAYARFDELTLRIEKIHAMEANALTAEEEERLVSLRTQLGEVRTVLEREDSASRPLRESAQAAAEEFSESLEAAKIAAQSIATVYQLNCEAYAPGRPSAG